VIKQRYESAMSYLKGIRDGKINLGPVGSSAAASPTGTAQVVQGAPTFNDQTLANY
jgi:phage gp36-like protein